MARKLISVLWLGLLLLTAACDTTFQCIEPDDYTGLSTAIQSKPPTQNIHTISVPIAPEFTDWKDTGYVTNGDDVLVVVRNNYDDTGHFSNTLNPAHSWTSWFGNLITNNQFLINEVCQSVNSDGSWCNNPQNGSTVQNPPCVFTQGVGAFIMLLPVHDQANTGTGEDPKNGAIYHMAIGANCSNSNTIGQSTTVTIQDAGHQSGGIYIAKENLPPLCASDGSGVGKCKLYVKILDQIYEDNYGGYTINLKRGFLTNSGGPFQSLVSTVTSTLSSSTEKIFTYMQDYLGYIRIMLQLFIIVTALSFLMGFLELTQKELLIRIFKIAIVIQLTMPNSWQFFNKYLFQIFTQGVGEVINMMSPDSDQGPFAIFDNMLSLLTSANLRAKMTALIWTNGLGFVFFVLFYVIMVLAIYSAFKATMVYLVSFCIISVLIILAPIFIPFVLFGFTKKIFENWFNNLIGYFVQPIIVMSISVFMITLIINKAYYLSGIRVCWQSIFPIHITSNFGFDIYSWFPAEINNSQAKILIPGGACSCSDLSNSTCVNNSDITCSDNSNENTGFCTPYNCYGTRVSDLPYLDIQKDADKISSLQSGTFVRSIDVLSFAFLAWLMLRFVEMAPRIAKAISGMNYSMTNIGNAGTAISQMLSSYSMELVNFVGTNISRVNNFGKAYRKARTDGLGKTAALFDGMSAAYDTKQVDTAKLITKNTVNKWQDLVGGSVVGKAIDKLSLKKTLEFTQATGYGLAAGTTYAVSKQLSKGALSVLKNTANFARHPIDTTKSARDTIKSLKDPKALGRGLLSAAKAIGSTSLEVASDIKKVGLPTYQKAQKYNEVINKALDDPRATLIKADDRLGVSRFGGARKLNEVVESKVIPKWQKLGTLMEKAYYETSHFGNILSLGYIGQNMDKDEDEYGLTRADYLKAYKDLYK